MVLSQLKDGCANNLKSIHKYTQWHSTVNDPEGYDGLCYQKQRITNLVVLRLSSLDHPQRNIRHYQRQPEILQQAMCWIATSPKNTPQDDVQMSPR